MGVLFLVFGMAQFLCMTPAGYILDYSKHKIRLVQGAAIGIATLTTISVSTAHWGGGGSLEGTIWLAFLCCLQGAGTSILLPGFNAVTLGIVGSTGFTHQTSRNRMMNHIGTAFVVALGSLLAYVLYPNIGVLFVVSPLSAVGVIYFLRQIVPTHVNEEAARSLILDSPTLTEYEFADSLARAKQEAAELARRPYGQEAPYSLSFNHSSSSSDDGDSYHIIQSSRGSILPPPSSIVNPRKLGNSSSASKTQELSATNGQVGNVAAKPYSQSRSPSFNFGGGDRDNDEPMQAQDPLSVLLSPRLIVFVIITFLFHLANSSVLPLVMQSLALRDPRSGILLSGLCIFIGQGCMTFFAKVCGDYSPIWGRKNLYLAGLSSLCLRCYMLTFLMSAEENPVSVISDSGEHIIKAMIMSTQILDSVGAGLIGTLQILVISDLASLTGRFSLVMGVVTASMCLGATVSGYVGQALAQDYGYDAAFAALGMISIFPLVLYIIFMPETLPDHVRPQRSRRRFRELLKRWNESRRNLLRNHPHGKASERLVSTGDFSSPPHPHVELV